MSTHQVYSIGSEAHRAGALWFLRGLRGLISVQTAWMRGVTQMQDPDAVRERRSSRELARMSNRDLADIGVERDGY